MCLAQGFGQLFGEHVQIKQSRPIRLEPKMGGGMKKEASRISLYRLDYANYLPIPFGLKGLAVFLKAVFRCHQVIVKVRKRWTLRKVLAELLVAGSIVGLTACANLNTIDRATQLPGAKSSTGKAVHLDIQQRLLIVNHLGKYCAEPSPDALAAFAAEVGVSAGQPDHQALSAIIGGQSSTAGVGLRTQSITLMRDALFRMCEAYVNDALGPAQVAALLQRSQDLTAVILAVEQLTGAVVANQTSLTGSTTADASATALATANLLEQALAAEDRRQQELEQAQAELITAEAERDAAAQALSEAGSDQLPGSSTEQDNKEDTNTKVASKKAESKRASLAFMNAEQRVALRKKWLEHARRTREKIESNQDAAIADLSVSISSDAQFSNPAQRVQLDKAVSEQVVKSVEKMVTKVLEKDYTVESCMAIISTVSSNKSVNETVHLEKTKDLCLQLMQKKVEERTKAITYGYDDLSTVIDVWLKKNEGNRELLRTWLRENGYDIRVSALLIGKHRELRKKVIEHFKIAAITSPDKPADKPDEEPADNSNDLIDAWLKEGENNRELLRTWLEKNGHDIRVSALLVGKHGGLRKKIIEHFKIP